MMLSELIKILEDKKQEVGDQDICIHDQDYNELKFKKFYHHNDEGGDIIELWVMLEIVPDEPSK